MRASESKCKLPFVCTICVYKSKNDPKMPRICVYKLLICVYKLLICVYILGNLCVQIAHLCVQMERLCVQIRGFLYWHAIQKVVLYQFFDKKWCTSILDLCVQIGPFVCTNRGFCTYILFFVPMYHLHHPFSRILK